LIEPYHPEWVAQFNQEQAAIRDCIDTRIPLTIEHFGSTSIPGMPAKPVIDILIGAEKRHWPAIIQALTSIGYIHWNENPDPGREFLVKGMPPFGERRTHHIHICEVDSALWERLLFRDYLDCHPEERAAYAALKHQLARAFRDDREAYTRGKDNLIEEIMDRAKNWHPD
jgi:GrpB-like predicted nucleotidyltransferase (UPF0157 family)